MLVPMVPGMAPGARAPAGTPPNGSPPGPQPQAPPPGPTPGSSVCGTPPTGSPTATPPLFHGHHGARSPSPPPMTRHRSNTHPTSGPMHQVPVYAANRAGPPNRPVPVYALPQQVTPQAPMEPQISEPDQMMIEASPVEADVETRPCTPELPMMRQQSQSALSVEIAQELGDVAALSGRGLMIFHAQSCHKFGWVAETLVAMRGPCRSGILYLLNWRHAVIQSCVVDS